MKKILLVAMAIMVNACSGVTSGGVQNKKSGITPLYSVSKCSQVVVKSTYTACYSYEHKGATAVFYHLDGKLVGEGNIEQRPRFYEEQEIPEKYRSHYEDFYGHNIDRGHMRPDAATDWSWEKLRETYSLVNILPQYAVLNRKMWSKAERYARYIAVKLGAVDVFNIAHYPDTAPVKIGRASIDVPNRFYKIVYSKKHHFWRCFMYENLNYTAEEGAADSLESHVIDCANIEWDNGK